LLKKAPVPREKAKGKRENSLIATEKEGSPFWLFPFPLPPILFILLDRDPEARTRLRAVAATAGKPRIPDTRLLTVPHDQKNRDADNREQHDD
jgi:hypothetical protein